MAGPLLLVAARKKMIFPKASKGNPWKCPTGIADSKTLTRLQRECLFEVLIGVCDFGEGWVSAREIDRLGLAGGIRLGVKRALRNLKASDDDQIILDGPINYAPSSFAKVQCLIKADLRVPIVSAASVYAKVQRDRFMIRLAVNYPEYSFDRHVGYGTQAHMLALQRFGPLAAVHRRSFLPLKVARL